MAITLQESLRGVFYAPFYVALARDAYAVEGVEVRFISSPRPGDAARNVMDGDVDVCWGGPMRVMQAYQQMPECDLVSFAEVVTRDPFLLLGREPRRDFALRDLLGVRVATVSEVPTAWMCLQEDLRRVGIAPAGNYPRERPDDGGQCRGAAPWRGRCGAGVRTLRRGTARRGGGASVVCAGEPRADSYTTFYARRGLLAARQHELRRMVRAIHRTQKWVAAASGAAIAAEIAQYFVDVPAAILGDACARYKSLGIWGSDPRLPRAGYDRLRASLVSGGFVSTGTPYDVAVDNGLADAVVAEDPAPLQ